MVYNQQHAVLYVFRATLSDRLLTHSGVMATTQTCDQRVAGMTPAAVALSRNNRRHVYTLRASVAGSMINFVAGQLTVNAVQKLPPDRVYYG